MKTNLAIGVALLTVSAWAQTPPAPPAPLAPPAPEHAVADAVRHAQDQLRRLQEVAQLPPAQAMEQAVRVAQFQVQRAQDRVQRAQDQVRHAQERLAAGSPYLGIGVQDIDAARARALNLKEDRGVEVTSVTAGSPAAKAGVKEGDVILEYNGQDVQGGEQLSRLVRETPLGREVKIGVWRNGAMVTLAATIEERRNAWNYGPWNMPDFRMPQFVMPEIPVPRFDYQSHMLGILGEPLGQEPQFAEFFGVKSGVLVKSVVKNSAAEKAGLKAGDVITKVDGTTVGNPQEITRALRNLNGKTTVTVTVVRNHKEMPVTVNLEAGLPGAVKANWFIPWPRAIVIDQVI